MLFSPGTGLDYHKFVSLLAAGDMGDVYKAKDLKYRATDFPRKMWDGGPR